MDGRPVDEETIGWTGDRSKACIGAQWSTGVSQGEAFHGNQSKACISAHWSTGVQSGRGRSVGGRPRQESSQGDGRGTEQLDEYLSVTDEHLGVPLGRDRRVAWLAFEAHLGVPMGLDRGAYRAARRVAWRGH